MKTDRELLELAAKAAGYDVRWHWNWECFVHVGPHNITSPPTMAGERMHWIPLDDDGDALRLAVSLNLHILRFDTMTTVRKIGADWGCDERDDGDPNAATRRAIVRAAAAIGENMK